MRPFPTVPAPGLRCRHWHFRPTPLELFRREHEGQHGRFHRRQLEARLQRQFPLVFDPSSMALDVLEQRTHLRHPHTAAAGRPGHVAQTPGDLRHQPDGLAHAHPERHLHPVPFPKLHAHTDTSDLHYATTHAGCDPANRPGKVPGFGGF